MEYKISELVAKSDVPKSTILYYIREGLLPEAKKLKSNVHRYDYEHLELLKYIQYMKQHIGSSNEEIKAALEKKNQSLSSSYSMLAPLMQTLSGVPPETKSYTKEQFLSHYGFDKKRVDSLLQKGILLPINSEYTEKEASLVRLIEKFEDVGLEPKIVKEYIYHAEALSALELELQKSLCQRRSDENFSTLWKIMFGTLFSAKEYIFSRYTHKALFDSLKEELKSKD